MENCYLCGEVFNEANVIKHGEHIIQQAIGGTLTDDSILCAECGRKLGKLVDDPFNKMFDGICTRLDIRKDRDNGKKKTAKGFVSGKDVYGNDLNGTPVFWKEGKVNPVRPFHVYIADESKIIVYSEKKESKNYLKIVNQEISEKFDKDSMPEVVVCDDITALITYPLEIDNGAFKKGLAKIAIGFASKAGVKRECLDLVLDSKLKKIREDIALVQFYPLSLFDEIIENDKPNIGNYPAHTLILFTAASNNSVLVCYIELFSTFQWYVILSENYDGEAVFEGYSQRVDKVEEYKFTPDRRYYKERNIILSHLGISEERIMATYERQKNNTNAKSLEDIEYKIINEEHIRQKHKVDFDDALESGIRYVLNGSIRSIIGGSTSLDAVKDMKMNGELFFMPDGDSEIFNPSSYRRCYIRDGISHDYIYSLLDSRKVNGFLEKIRKYGYKKVYMLSEYIQKKNILDKMKS